MKKIIIVIALLLSFFSYGNEQAVRRVINQAFESLAYGDYNGYLELLTEDYEQKITFGKQSEVVNYNSLKGVFLVISGNCTKDTLIDLCDSYNISKEVAEEIKNNYDQEAFDKLAESVKKSYKYKLNTLVIKNITVYNAHATGTYECSDLEIGGHNIFSCKGIMNLRRENGIWKIEKEELFIEAFSAQQYFID